MLNLSTHKKPYLVNLLEQDPSADETPVQQLYSQFLRFVSIDEYQFNSAGENLNIVSKMLEICEENPELYLLTALFLLNSDNFPVAMAKVLNYHS